MDFSKDFETHEKEVQHLTETFKKYFEVPIVVQGRLDVSEDGAALDVTTRWTQNDLLKKGKTKFQRHQRLLPQALPPTPATPLPESVLWTVPHDYSDKVARVVNFKEEDAKEPSTHFEIWSRDQRLQVINVTALDVHGKVYDNDDAFGAVSWSRKGDYLVYIAERKWPEARKFYNQEKQTDGADTEKKEKKEKSDENRRHGTWGEVLSPKEHPMVCVLDLGAGFVTVVTQPGLSAGHPIWAPDGKGVVFIGFPELAYNLGLIYCSQRRNALYYYDLEEKTTVPLTPEEGYAVSEIRFSPDGSKLLYCETREGGPHRSGVKIMIMDWATKGSQLIVDTLKRPTETFSGMYNPLTSRCWAKDSDRVVFTSTHGVRQFVYVVETSSQRLTRLPVPEGFRGCMECWDVREDYVLVRCAIMGTTPTLMYGRLPSVGEESAMQWVALPMAPPAQVMEIPVNVRTVTLPALPDNPQYPDLNVECVLAAPAKRNDRCPLLIIPHGGPHSGFTVNSLSLFTYMVQCGFAIALINYRGSTGYGEDCVNSLPGNIGDLDVKDVQTIAEHLVKEEHFAQDKVALFGGSHGGFLIAHLISQYPDFYKGACLRNPVINLSSMISCTDIPDWCYVECGLDFYHGRVPSAEVYKKALEMSPIVNAHRIRCPVLLQVGLKDLRVPAQQGYELYNTLKAQGKNVRMLEYKNDCHGLSSVGTSAHTFLYNMLHTCTHLNVTLEDMLAPAGNSSEPACL